MNRSYRRQLQRFSPLLLAVIALLSSLVEHAAAAPAPARCSAPGIALQLLICGGMLITTCVFHLVITVLLSELTHEQRLVSRWASRIRGRALVVLFGAGLIALVLLVDILLWALLFKGLDLMPTLETSMYFSGVTFTTVGYGDLTLPKCWQLLSVGLAVNGLLLAGWSTALLVFLVQRAMELRLQNQSKPGP
ncbi:MAG: potassium channel family protein [Vulcanococcus sp.]